jgi:N6-L-threonylcarbamoyladenine synthase
MSAILGVETSCDETAASIVVDGREILASIVASQVEIHRQYGGVFPEMASRQHVVDIIPVIRETMTRAGVKWSGLDAIAVTSGPGLVGSLLVGVNVAKAVAWARGLPLIGINHLEAHLYSNWLIPSGKANDDPAAARSDPVFPLICLIVSGGHTDLVLMSNHGQYQVLGRTLDDAAGEAFDKVARLLGLGYPGGPAVEAVAKGGDAEAFDLPRAWLHDSYDFSFSGLKTAVLRIVQQYEGIGSRPKKTRARKTDSEAPPDLPLSDLAASFQAAIVEVLVQKTRRAADEFRVAEVLLAGGVASNALLRQQMKSQVTVPVRCPPPVLCTDNAAMVAAAAHYKHISGEQADMNLDVHPRLRME